LSLIQLLIPHAMFAARSLTLKSTNQ
jgi:hypothetical protein